jgi:8-oxo-dGTP pyrophosphatase MutT (NUDIX family)
MQIRRDTMRELLLDYHPGQTREQAYLVRMLELVGGAADPFARDNYVPGHFTASSFVLSPERNELLLIYHAKLERWLQPGGHFEPEDSSALVAAQREVSEEVNLVKLTPLGHGILDVDVHLIPPHKHCPAHEHFDVRFGWVSETRDIRAGSDAVECRWVRFEDIASLQTDESVLRAVHKLTLYRAD